jgi:superfamily II DNA or RNA helicase
MHIPPTVDHARVSSGSLEPRDGHPIQVGDAVRIRGQRWRVAALRTIDGCAVVTLIGIGPCNTAMERRILSPYERIEPLNRPARLRLTSRRRWGTVCRALISEQGPANMLRSALRARMDLLPYQLEPALAVVGGLGSRVLIADEVGLGKTIQAGLIVAELRARGAADRVLVLAPAGLREQWAGELRDRFGLEGVVLDMREARQRSSELPLGVNPWSTTPVAIASIDYVKRPEVLPAALDCRWDIVVVDEAHGIAPRTERHEAIAALCACAPHVVLLTATPHSGDEVAFASLCDLGRHGDGPLLVFRRSRQDAALGGNRHVHCLRVRPSIEERRMHEILARFTQEARMEGGARTSQARLALSVLHKRALSSAFALEQSARRRLKVLAPRPDETWQLDLPLHDAGEGDASDEALPWTEPVLQDADRERALLHALAEAAAVAAFGESKIRALIRLLTRLRARDERVIVFTEYRDTLLHLRDRLSLSCAVLHGGLARDERRAALDDFDAGRLPVLLATDAAGEGLNLHRRGRVVINLELPWNPTRLEQRAGRVDRIGQHRAVHAFHLVAHDTAEVRILERLRARIGRARHTIAVSDPLGTSAADEEEIATRLVLEGDITVDLTRTTHQRDSLDQQRLRTLRLEEEGAEECARLRWNRVFLQGNDGTAPVAPGEGPLVVFARRPAVRSALGLRLLVLLQSLVADSTGRVAASHLTALAMTVSPRVVRNRAIDSLSRLLRTLSPPTLVGLDPSYAKWRTDAECSHRRFWESRLARECATRPVQFGPSTQAYQPGLFDRRAVCAAQTDRDRELARADESTRRISAAQLAASVEPTTPRVVLLLVP